MSQGFGGGQECQGMRKSEVGAEDWQSALAVDRDPG